MLPANVISALQVLSNAGKPQVTVTNEPKPASNLEPGQQLQGTVQDKISEGLFKVQVAGQTLQMRLPGNIQSGDTIKLEVITARPRVTFGLVASSNPLSTPEQIGSAARLLSNLAERPIERPIVQQLAGKAVWSAEQQEAPDPKLLAGALRETLGKNGLFYESHQAQWIRGERSINQLLEEPQNLLTGKSPPLSAAAQKAALDKASAALSQANAPVSAKPATEQQAAPDKTSAALPQASPPATAKSSAVQQAALDKVSAAQTAANNPATVKSPADQYAAIEKMTMMPVRLPAEQQAALDKTAAAQMQANMPAQARAAGDAAQPIAKELVHMVQQQLHTLEQHHLVWMGQVWPGQQMQWEIRGQPEHQSRQQDERQWSTEMELDLPVLGNVHARLVFAGSGLRMALRAAEPETVALFNRALPRLEKSLAAAGIPLAAAVVETAMAKNSHEK